MEYKSSDCIFTILTALAAGSMCLLLNGGGMIALLIGLQDFSLDLFVAQRILSSFSTAWICGFVIPGSPGGIGVREAILTMLLEDLVDGPKLVFLIIAHRLVSIIGDFLFCVIVSIPNNIKHKK